MVFLQVACQRGGFHDLDTGAETQQHPDQLAVDDDADAEQRLAVVGLLQYLLRVVERLGDEVRRVGCRSPELDGLGAVALVAGHTHHLAEIAFRVEALRLDVGLLGQQLHRLYAVEGVDVGVARLVLALAEDEPAVVELLEHVGVEDEGLRASCLERLVGQLDGAAALQRVVEHRHVFQPFQAVVALHQYLESLRDGIGDNRPFLRYGGHSLHECSHGEGMVSFFENRLQCGFYIFDEQEAALSYQNQLRFVVWDRRAVVEGSQIIISTHSPVMLAYPDADIFTIGDEGPERVSYESSYIYRDMLAFVNNVPLVQRELGLLD